MADFEIQIQGNDIHAEIAGGSFSMLENTSYVIDPISLSYSNIGTLCDYNLIISNISGLTYYDVLENGKNSRFAAEGTGTCDLTLTVYDDAGNFDSDVITITVI